MAETVCWHLEHGPPDTRIVLAAHNNHLQKVPVAYDGVLTSLPMGQQLDRVLGTDYVALAVTSTADHVPEMVLDDTAPAGFTVVDTPLGPPEPAASRPRRPTPGSASRWPTCATPPTAPTASARRAPTCAYRSARRSTGCSSCRP